MSTGLSFLSAVVREGSREVLRDVNADWFTEGEEQRFYEFVRDHMRRHGRLPTEESVNAEGFRLRQTREPASYYAERLRKRAIFTHITEVLPRFTQAVGQHDVEQAVAMLAEMHRAALVTANAVDVHLLSEEAQLLVQRLRERRMQGDMQGITTGWPTLDELTGGWMRGDACTFVGRPSVGKSYVLFKAAHAAIRSGYSALLVTMEMSVEQCVNRLIAMESGVNPRFLRNGQVSMFAEPRLRDAIAEIGDLPPVHVLAGDVRKTVGDIDSIVQQHEPDIIYIDAGYLLTPERQRRRSSRREYVADAMEEIKALAMSRNRPVVTTVQFNREARKGRNVMDLGTIAETDVIGQIMSVVIGIREGEGVNTRQREMAVMKNRDGEKGTFHINFSHTPMDFSEIPEEEIRARMDEDDEDERL